MNALPSDRGSSNEAWRSAASLVGPDELAALYEASATLARSLDLRQTQEAIVVTARRRFGYDRAGLWLYDREADCIRGTVGTDESLNLRDEQHLQIPFSEVPAPMRSVLTGDLPFYLTDDLERDLPSMSRVEMQGVRANAVVPLRQGEEVLGFLSVDNLVSGRPITEAQARLMLLYANYAAAALHNAVIAEQTREHIAEAELRRQLERKIRHLQQVHAIAAEITSLQLEDVLRILRDRITEVFHFDRAGILLWDPQQPGVLRGTWGTDYQGRSVDEREIVYGIEEHSDLAAIVSGDRPYILRHWSYEDESLKARSGKAVDPDEIRQHVLIQLRNSQRLLGILSVDNILTGRPITEEDIEILLLLAGHASLAIQKAHVYALEQEVNTRLRGVLSRESRIAHTLQNAFKPNVGQYLYAARIAHIYRPAMKESELGGDFYDVLDLGQGRIALVMADVSGKGLTAAARTARARFALQAYAFEDPRPLSVMHRLNRFLYERCNPAGDFITVFYGVYDTITGEVRCASAGHEPPLLIRKGAQPEFLEFPGIPCGIYTDQACEEGYFVLDPGDRLLLYSDGVTEARQDRQLFGFDGLRNALIAEDSCPPDSLVRRLYHHALRFSNGIMRDDVALLLVEAQPPEIEGPAATGDPRIPAPSN